MFTSYFPFSMSVFFSISTFFQWQCKMWRCKKTSRNKSEIGIGKKIQIKWQFKFFKKCFNAIVSLFRSVFVFNATFHCFSLIASNLSSFNMTRDAYRIVWCGRTSLVSASCDTFGTEMKDVSEGVCLGWYLSWLFVCLVLVFTAWTELWLMIDYCTSTFVQFLTEWKFYQREICQVYVFHFVRPYQDCLRKWMYLLPVNTSGGVG